MKRMKWKRKRKTILIFKCTPLLYRYLYLDSLRFGFDEFDSLIKDGHSCTDIHNIIYFNHPSAFHFRQRKKTRWKKKSVNIFQSFQTKRKIEGIMPVELVRVQRCPKLFYSSYVRAFRLPCGDKKAIWRKRNPTNEMIIIFPKKGKRTLGKKRNDVTSHCFIHH